jgi:hypothetical protein
MYGCLGYQLGGSRPEGINSVYMAPVINQTTEPAIELQVTHALRNRIQFDGRMKLENTEENADAVIEVKLINYRLQPIAYRKDRTTTPASYRLRITATAELKDRESGKVLSSSKTYGEATFDFVSDLTTSKRNAHPAAAKDIANYMIDDLIERW